MMDARELIEELRRAPDELTVRRIVASARDSLTSGTEMDKGRFNELAQACSDRGIPLGVPWHAVAVGLGEARIEIGARIGVCIAKKVGGIEADLCSDC